MNQDILVLWLPAEKVYRLVRIPSDAVWVAASLLHVPRPPLPRVLGLICNALKPGGLHFASYKTGAVEGRGDHGRYCNHLERNEVLELRQTAAPWEVEDIVDTVEAFSASEDPGC